MRVILFLSLLLSAIVSGCDVTGPAKNDCAEFDHHTVRRGTHVTCRMLWCERGFVDSMYGGPALLWCEDDAE